MAGPYYGCFEVWGKVKAEDEWTYLFSNFGSFVEPSKRVTTLAGYRNVRGLDSVVRYLRWRCSPNCNSGQEGYRGSVCIDGIQEMWVWGEPKGERSGIKPFQPWIPNEGAPPVKWTTTAPDPDACQIVPRPRKMEKAEGWFVIGPGTKIVAQPEAEARKVAKQIQEEVHERWQIDVPVAEEPAEAGAKLSDVVYVGQPSRGALAERRRQEEGLEIAAKPQAYALRVSPRGMVVLGRDKEGLYWGVQSLMLAMRWHSSKDPKQNGLGVRCLKIEDWPATLDRSLLYIKPTLFNAWESEIYRVERLAHVQSRFKWNACYVDLFCTGSLPAPALGWPEGRTARLCHDMRDRYHMDVRGELFTSTLDAPNYWIALAHEAKDLSPVEADPDEDASELGQLLNFCPMEPKTYALQAARLDKALEILGYPSQVWLGAQLYGGRAGGSRWRNVGDVSGAGRTGRNCMRCTWARSPACCGSGTSPACWKLRSCTGAEIARRSRRTR